MKLEDLELEHRKPVEELIKKYSEINQSSIMQYYQKNRYMIEENNPYLNGELPGLTKRRTIEDLECYRRQKLF